MPKIENNKPIRKACLNPNCKYIWYSRNKKPLVCVKCKSFYWNDKKHWEKKK